MSDKASLSSLSMRSSVSPLHRGPRSDRRIALSSSLLLVLLGACSSGSPGKDASGPQPDLSTDMAPASADVRPDTAAADAADAQGQQPETGTDARDGGTDLVAAGCPACAADELCVQINDSSTLCHSATATLVCRKVSSACAAAVDAAKKSCLAASAACQAELCPAPTQCKISPPCGNESPAARVYCYGP
jgi:hypothetical protein